MSGSRTRRLMGLTVWALAVPTGLIHILFGLANFQPGFPKLEGVTAITAGLAILASVAVARRSLFHALLTAFFGTLPMAAWFTYAVPVQRSSDPVFFWASLVLPTGTGLSALNMSRRATSGRHRQVPRSWPAPLRAPLSPPTEVRRPPSERHRPVGAANTGRDPLQARGP